MALEKYCFALFSLALSKYRVCHCSHWHWQSPEFVTLRLINGIGKVLFRTVLTGIAKSSLSHSSSWHCPKSSLSHSSSWHCPKSSVSHSSSCHCPKSSLSHSSSWHCKVEFVTFLQLALQSRVCPILPAGIAKSSLSHSSSWHCPKVEFVTLLQLALPEK